MNLVDTAECYGDHLAEALIGAAIGQRRDDWVIATKFGHRFHPEAMQQDRWSRFLSAATTGHPTR